MGEDGNKQAAFKALHYLEKVLQDTAFHVLDFAVRGDSGDAYLLDVKLGLTQQELQRATSDEMVHVAEREVAKMKLTHHDDDTFEVEINLPEEEENQYNDDLDEVDLDDDRVITNAQFDGKPLPEGSILTGKQMKQRLQARMQTSMQEEKQYNQELLDLSILEEQEQLPVPKPATIQDAQKTPKVVRRRQKDSIVVDEAEVANALEKRKPKSVTAAHNMSPRALSKDDLKSLATSFSDDWDKEFTVGEEESEE